jgi:hypothetical protein
MRAGPRETIFFEPHAVKAAIVTCGGLCPGLNDVIRQLVITLEEYGVDNIVGVKYGFRGFVEQVRDFPNHHVPRLLLCMEYSRKVLPTPSTLPNPLYTSRETDTLLLFYRARKGRTGHPSR